MTGRPRDAGTAFAPRLPAKPFPAVALAFEKPEWGGHRRAESPNLARAVREPQLPVQTADVVVIGGGVVGACLAYYLAKEGTEVLVVERDDTLSHVQRRCLTPPVTGRLPEQLPHRVPRVDSEHHQWQRP